MTPLALGLVLIAAFTHATWNYAAKRSGGGLPFVWVSSVFALALYSVAGLVYWLWRQPVLPAGLWWVVVGSGILKTIYSLLLQRAYRHGDFSLVYPLTRGTAPLLATLGAIAFFGERPSPLALAGGGLIVAGVFFLSGGLRMFQADRAHLRQGILYGLACATCVGIYTVWDQRAVSHLQLPPILYDGGTQLVLFSILTPFALHRRDEVAATWRDHRGKAALVGLLSPVAYVLVLYAMSFTPVSYVAPAREISILIGAFFGAKLLREADAPRRLLAAAAMVAGIIALALG
ncbi:EamA-like transporter family protein [Lacunisphaera limnophila]|uniref:EamA-like transporter family protein n=1 Tax=Lacunisphaera limnophila TaxID=1838286 RepID=A0A1D8AU29_9BACT|nr:EamA family transporter [Lacunisphaera limnophila]AOS44399.1 EamA-like transporter family protein [Lacunisphaera limnophila]